MGKPLNQYTTEEILHLEKIGGIISEGVMPIGASSQSTLKDWQDSMPLVLPTLVEVWYNQSVLTRQLAELKTFYKI